MQVQQLKDSTLRKDKREIQRLAKINSELSADVHKLQTQLKETAEHNELLEFRLLELEDIETTTKMRLTDSQNVRNTRIKNTYLIINFEKLSKNAFEWFESRFF